MTGNPQFLRVRDTSPDTLKANGAGGKAIGLSRLCQWGLAVPEAYVLVGAESVSDLPLGALEPSFIAGPLAVRSSSQAEDGENQSFAGQFDTVLDVCGPDALMAAIQRCLDSARSARAAAYRGEEEPGGKPEAMGVVLQRMVSASAAGVLFSADPMTGRRDRIVLDAVKGLGDALVSGHVSPHHCLLTSQGEVVAEELPDEGPAIEHATIAQLVTEAQKASAAFGAPLDLEWAVDQSGHIQWLQARPITTLPDPLDDQDTQEVNPSDVYTRCNIGEMMPGAVTPLTASVTMRGIDYGIQAMQVAVGVRARIEQRPVFTAQFSGHLFLNLSAFGPMIRGVAGSNAERLCRAICGRPIPELDTGRPLSAWRRMVHGIRYGIYLMGARRHRNALQRDVDTLDAPLDAPMDQVYQWIDRNLIVLNQAYDHHMASSAVAGALVPALLEIVSKGMEPSAEHERHCAELLADGQGDGVESLDIAEGMQRLGRAVASDPEASKVLSTLSAEAVSEWLDADVGAAGAAWRDYLARHGHRAVRELELRQAEWAHDRGPLIDNLRLAVRAAALVEAPRLELQATRSSWLERLVAGKARRAAVGRERTKSLLVAVTTAFKAAYRCLGERLVAANRLSEVDDVFFFSHQELKRVIEESGSWSALASRRRTVLTYQSRLRFPEVFQGIGRPMDPVALEHRDSDGLRGKPVSAGVVRGNARVVQNLAELGTVQAGEILIAPVVDVGWTPCFPLIAGLVTEVGSAVSHGCVVAREFGLPAIVGVVGATDALVSGQLVELDANQGLITVLEE